MREGNGDFGPVGGDDPAGNVVGDRDFSFNAIGGFESQFDVFPAGPAANRERYRKILLEESIFERRPGARAGGTGGAASNPAVGAVGGEGADKTVGGVAPDPVVSAEGVGGAPVIPVQVVEGSLGDVQRFEVRGELAVVQVARDGLDGVFQQGSVGDALR